jgi:hypothetical protein
LAVACRPAPSRDVPDATWSSAPGARADSGDGAGNRAFHAPGSSIVPKQPSEAVERIVEELMDRSLSKADRMQRLRDLARSGEDVPDELLDQALRKLMERITE